MTPITTMTVATMVAWSIHEEEEDGLVCLFFDCAGLLATTVLRSRRVAFVQWVGGDWVVPQARTYGTVKYSTLPKVLTVDRSS